MANGRLSCFSSRFFLCFEIFSPCESGFVFLSLSQVLAQDRSQVSSRKRKGLPHRPLDCLYAALCGPRGLWVEILLKSEIPSGPLELLPEDGSDKLRFLFVFSRSFVCGSTEFQMFCPVWIEVVMGSKTDCGTWWKCLNILVCSLYKESIKNSMNVACLPHSYLSDWTYRRVHLVPFNVQTLRSWRPHPSPSYLTYRLTLSPHPQGIWNDYLGWSIHASVLV